MANIKVVKVDPTTGRKVVVALKDVSPYWLYDTKTISDTENIQSFFTNVKKNDDVATNMLNDSVLPYGWKFNIGAIRVVPDFSADPALVANLIYNSIVEFNKEGSEIFKAPAFVFNAGAGVPSKATNGDYTNQAVLLLPLQMQLEGNTPFEFRIKSKAQLGQGNSVTVKMVLDGIVYKNIVTA